MPPVIHGGRGPLNQVPRPVFLTDLQSQLFVCLWFRLTSILGQSFFSLSLVCANMSYSLYPLGP